MGDVPKLFHQQVLINLNIFAHNQSVEPSCKTQIPPGIESQIILLLRLGLQPEEFTLIRRRELEDEDTAIVWWCLVVWDELSIAGENNQVIFFFGSGGVATFPGEMDEVCEGG
jgi:hypothetical protein